MEKQETKEGAILAALSVMLVCVFVLSVWMYDDLAASAENGALSAFAGNVRDFLEENEAVAVFMEKEEEAETVSAAAEAYIARYNAVYTDLP